MPTIVDFLMRKVGWDIAWIILSYVWLERTRFNFLHELSQRIHGLSAYWCEVSAFFVVSEHQHRLDHYHNYVCDRSVVLWWPCQHVIYKSYYCGRDNCSFLMKTSKIDICNEIKKYAG